jgi:hypothetical protein
MGIPITSILKQNLEEISKEFNEEFGVSLRFPDKIARGGKASTLFEYFVLYNSVLALEPIEVKIIMRSRQGPSFLPVVGGKYWKTLRKIGECLEPSIVVKTFKKEFAIWFDRPFVFKEFGSLRPDILIRQGKFEFQDLSYNQEEKVELFKEEKLIAGVGTKRMEGMKNYEFPYASLGKPLYFYYKEEFVSPPLIIECKSYGGVLGNPEEYAKYASHVAIVTPEKAYEPKKENLHVIRLENSKYLSNQDCREKLRSFYNQIKLI